MIFCITNAREGYCQNRLRFLDEKEFNSKKGEGKMKKSIFMVLVCAILCVNYAHAQVADIAERVAEKVITVIVEQFPSLSDAFVGSLSDTGSANLSEAFETAFEGLNEMNRSIATNPAAAAMKLQTIANGILATDTTVDVSVVITPEMLRDIYLADEEVVSQTLSDASFSHIIEGVEASDGYLSLSDAQEKADMLAAAVVDNLVDQDYDLEVACDIANQRAMDLSKVITDAGITMEQFGTGVYN